MPRTRNKFIPIQDVSKHLRLTCMPDHCQDHWYYIAAQFIRGYTVIDVGSGTGSGLDILQLGQPSSIIGIDPLPVGPGVKEGHIELEPSGSYDFVTAIDVIEHTEDPDAFIIEAVRVARLGVFFSTPNWNYFECNNMFHAFEFTPAELEAFLAPYNYLVWSEAEAPLYKVRIAVPVNSVYDVGPNFGILIIK